MNDAINGSGDAPSERFLLIKEKIKEFPLTPGVYLMKNQNEKIIYVGKAKNLRTRVRNYFQGLNDHPARTRFLVRQIYDLDFILTPTEVEALLLEATLIKKHRPKFNIRLKDDKSYPYIKYSAEDDFPRLYFSRKVKKDGGIYFGPFPRGQSISETIRFLNRLFKIRDCNDAFFKSRKRPCLTYQIGRCSAPCVDYVTKDQYRSEVHPALTFLQGQDRQLIQDLKLKMKQSSVEERFEVAAHLRDTIGALSSVLEKQSVLSHKQKLDQDAISFFGDERGCLIETLHVRQGRLLGARPFFFSHINPQDRGEDLRDWLISFLNQYYDENMIPDEVLLSVDLGRDLTQLLENLLTQRKEKKVSVKLAHESSRRKLVEMATKNAEAQFEKFVTQTDERRLGLEEIKTKLSLPTLPSRIECYDISTFQGKETVASQVVFTDGLPDRDQYRRYRIKTVTGIDDFLSMKEVISRRFAIKEKSADGTIRVEQPKPDLIVIDGGKGQLGVVTKLLQEMQQSYPVVGLAKARTASDFKSQKLKQTEERFYLPGRQNPVVFRPSSDAYQVLVGIRDEAHRFAITYHRKLREATSLESELDSVVGLGDKRRKELLGRFGSLDQIKLATAEEIAKIKGFNRILAERILLQLQEPEEPEV